MKAREAGQAEAGRNKQEKNMQSHVNGDLFPQVPESVGKRPAMLVYEGASAGVAKKRWVEEHRSRTRLSDKLSLRPPLVGVWPWQLSGERRERVQK